MSRFPRFVLANFVFFAAVIAAQGQVAPAPSNQNVAFVADGAGNYQMASKSIRATAAATNSSLTVETFVWSHGDKKVMPDHTDVAHARQQGKRLAEVVLAYRHSHPDARIHLVGHSAGSMVVLAATEWLPPQTLDRIVLLLPSVSTEYDIRPALRSVRSSMEVHYSGQDWLYLGLCMRLLGCADGSRSCAGGRVGFQLRIESPQDAALLDRLVQIPWQPSHRSLGHDGGHYGAYQPDYLKAYVLPVLVSPPR